MILIDALYINNSGGKVLLDELVTSLEAQNKNVFYLFDQRCINDFTDIPYFRKKFLVSGIRSRHQFYKENEKNIEKVFCFANIPPPVKLSVPVYTYFHNVNLLSIPPGTSFRNSITFFLKRLFIMFYINNSDRFIVQSVKVKEMITKKLRVVPDKVEVLPFFRTIFNNEKHKLKKRNTFVYISNGNAHKNHYRLLSAWEMLSKQNCFPELHLTVTEHYPALINKIKQYNDSGLKIYNHGYCDPATLYSESVYCIYPSLAESFGLGLIESIQGGCKVIASDLSYVRAVIEPSLVFDPMKPESIAKAVRTCLDNENIPTSSIIVKNELQKLIDLL